MEYQASGYFGTPASHNEDLAGNTDTLAETKPLSQKTADGLKVNRPMHRIVWRMRSARDADAAVCDAALAYLNIDYSKLNSREAIAEAYSNCNQAIQLLGPLKSEYRQALLDSQKVLDRYLEQRLAMEQMTFRSEVEPFIRKLIAGLEKHLPSEVHASIKASFDRIFGQ